MTAGSDEAPLSQAEQEAAEWLARLRAGDRRDQQAFENWYSGDPVNADAYDRVLASWEAAGRVRTATAAPRNLRPRWGYAAAGVAAMLALFVCISAVVNPWRSAPIKPFAASTVVGEIRTVALDDGTKVTLDTQSAIRADFDAARRQVHLLRGRAHFDVAAEPRPFLISTATSTLSTGGSVVDVAFDGRETQVGLVSGTAELRPGNQQAAFIRLAPGQSLALGRNGPVGSVRRYAASDTRWMVGMLSFEDAPLTEVIAAANRYSDRRITLADPSLGSLKFTGTFKAKDTLGLARMVAAMFNLQCDASKPEKLILSR